MRYCVSVVVQFYYVEVYVMLPLSTILDHPPKFNFSCSYKNIVISHLLRSSCLFDQKFHNHKNCKFIAICQTPSLSQKKLWHILVNIHFVPSWIHFCPTQLWISLVFILRGHHTTLEERKGRWNWLYLGFDVIAEK